MHRLARFVAILLALALVAGAVINAVQATTMAMDMAPGALSDGSMPDCDDCPGGDDGATVCASVCLAPAAAVLPAGASVTGPLTSTFVAAPAQALADHHRPPDPYPPRATVLG